MRKAVPELAIRCQDGMEEVSARNLRAVVCTAVGGESSDLASCRSEGSRDGGRARCARDA